MRRCWSNIAKPYAASLPFAPQGEAEGDSSLLAGPGCKILNENEQLAQVHLIWEALGKARLRLRPWATNAAVAVCRWAKGNLVKLCRLLYGKEAVLCILPYAENLPWSLKVSSKVGDPDFTEGARLLVLVPKEEPPAVTINELGLRLRRRGWAAQSRIGSPPRYCKQLPEPEVPGWEPPCRSLKRPPL